MKSLLMRIPCDSGQAFVLVAFMLTVLVGMAALVIDGGSWYRAQRHLQTAADSAALAGAQELPLDQAKAKAKALDYATLNYAGTPVPTVTFPDAGTIDVAATATAPGIFARIYGSAFNDVDIRAHAQAQVRVPLSVKQVVPFGVNVLTEKLKDFGSPTTLPVGKTGAPGAFDVINIDGSKGGTNVETLFDWSRDGYMGLGNYFSDTGARWDSNGAQTELTVRLNTDLLFPVYEHLDGNGAGAQYHVIGWAGFHMTDFDLRGSSGSITGYFTDFIATELAGATTPLDSHNDFGVHVITLTQ